MTGTGYTFKVPDDLTGRDDARAKPEAPVVEPSAEAPEHLEEPIAGWRSTPTTYSTVRIARPGRLTE